MTHIARSVVPLFLLALAAGCDRPAGEAPPSDAAPQQAVDTPPASAAEAETWRANPAGAGIRVEGGALVLETGPHTILWRGGGEELAPPYTLRATLEKRSGRLSEGVGLLFGGSGLEGPESGQVYSYFLVRGDGSFLVKRRQGAETPVVRDWTAHPAIRRDGEEGGRPNELEVRVGLSDVAFVVNGQEVARVPAADLSVRGRAGVRVSHDVQLAVSGWRVSHTADGEAPPTTEGAAPDSAAPDSAAPGSAAP